MCIDHRALNKKNIGSQVTIPRIDKLWDQIGGSEYFSLIVLKGGYHQIRIREQDIEKTAFRTIYSQFEFIVTPFGLTGAPGVFQTLINNICRKYIDDILIYSKKREHHKNIYKLY